MRDDFGEYEDNGADMDDVQLNRSIKDRSWSHGYILLMFGLIFGVLRNVAFSSPWSLARGRNYQGLVCGVDSGVRQLPYLYYPLDPAKQPASLKLDRGLCVSYCPTEKDVAKKGYVSVPEIALLEDKKKETFTTILHSLKSPLYATTLAGKSLCMPKDGGIGHDPHELLVSAGLTDTRLVASDMYNSVPVLIGLILVSILLSNFIIQINVNYNIILLLASSILLLFGSFKGGFDIFSMPILGAGIYIPIFIVTSWTTINDGYRVIAATQRSEVPSLLKANLIIQLTMAFFANCGVVLYLFLTSQTVLETSNFDASINPNGGIQIVPLQRKAGHIFSLHIIVLVSTIATILLLESLLVMAKYCAAFSTMIWYFKGTQSKADGVANGFYTACQYYTGSMAKFAFARLLGKWSSNAALCEVVLLGRSQAESTYLAENRINESKQTTATASCLGLAANSTKVAAIFFWAASFTISKTILSYLHEDLSRYSSTSASFTASILASIVAYIASLPWSTQEAASDALLYSAMIETMTKAGTNSDIRDEVDLDLSRDYSQCPEPIVNLLDEFATRRSVRGEEPEYFQDSQ